tara:strand:- start:2413 stop:4020 length:1608 start_codon:yes stop_codon:yes gene_type:complete
MVEKEVKIIRNKSVVSLEKVRSLFDETKQLTNNFRNIRDDLLLEKTRKKYSPSSRLLILRLGMRMNRRDFMEFLGISRQTLSSYESGFVKIKNLETSIKYIDKIRKKLNRQIIWKDILLGYEFWLTEIDSSLRLAGKKAGNLTKKRHGVRHFKNIAKIGARKGGLAILDKYGKEFYRKNGLKGGPIGGKKGGLTMAKISALTEQERIFLGKLQNKGYICFWRLLDKIILFENGKKKGIGFDEFNGLDLGNKYCEIRPSIKLDRIYIPDFLIYNKKLKIVVECTRSSKNNSSTYLNSIKLSNRAKLFRKKHKHFIVVLSDMAPINSVLPLLDSTRVVFERDIDVFLDVVENNRSLRKLDKICEDYLLKRESCKQLKAVSYSMKKPRTLQEKKIYDFLSKKGYDFEFGYYFSNQFGSRHFVDFVVFDENKPKICIEATQIDKLPYKNIILGTLRLWRTIHFSKNYYSPNMQYIGMISHSKMDLVNYKEVYKIGSICDELILDDDLEKLKKILNRKLIKSKNPTSNEEIIQIWDKFRG